MSQGQQFPAPNEAIADLARGGYITRSWLHTLNTLWLKALGGTVTAVTATAPLTSSGGHTPDIALGASGVTAATYGDATHVPQIAVSAKGLITSASNVAITGVGALRTATGTIANAAIKTLPTTPITLVAGQGANTNVVLWFAYMYLDSTAGQYTNIDATAYSNLAYATGALSSNYLGNDATLTPARSYVTNTFGGAAKIWWQFFPWQDTVETNQWGNMVAPIVRESNVALQLTFTNGGSGNLTGGDPANTLKYVVYHTIEAAV